MAYYPLMAPKRLGVFSFKGYETMNELIKIERKTIGNEEINAVDARDLHEFLEEWLQIRGLD